MNGKPPIAIVVPGGIGRQDNIPVLLELLLCLAGIFDIFIYSFSALEPHQLLAAACTVVCAPSHTKSKFLKMLFFIGRIRKDYCIKQFIAVHGFWIMPQGIIAVLCGKILKIPSIITVPGGDVTYIPSIRYGSLSNSIKRMLARWCMDHASRIIMLTRFQQSAMLRHGISREQISIIPFGVDSFKFTFRPRPFSTPLQLAYIGNLNNVKDPFTLIKTFHTLTKKHNCRLTVIGSDILHGRVQAYARRLDVYDHIRWMGKIHNDEIPSQLHSADILLMTSLYEGQSVVVLEAFASGVVVVGTKVGLLADLESDEATASPGDAEGLANIVDALIQHPEEVKALQVKNRKFAEAFSALWTFEEYGKIYNELTCPNRH